MRFNLLWPSCVAAGESASSDTRSVARRRRSGRNSRSIIVSPADCTTRNDICPVPCCHVPTTPIWRSRGSWRSSCRANRARVIFLWELVFPGLVCCRGSRHRVAQSSHARRTSVGGGTDRPQRDPRGFRRRGGRQLEGGPWRTVVGDLRRRSVARRVCRPHPHRDDRLVVEMADGDFARSRREAQRRPDHPDRVDPEFDSYFRGLPCQGRRAAVWPCRSANRLVQ